MLKEVKAFSAYVRPFEKYTAIDLWTEPYMAKQILKVHLDPDHDGASRNHRFIGQSAQWIAEYAKLDETSKVCDIGCGPGLYTSIFSRMGIHTTGVDVSDVALDYARNFAKEHNLTVNYIHKNYLEMDFLESFELVIMIYCDYGALNKEQRQNLLQRVYKSLKPGGKFILDVFSLEHFDNKEVEQDWVYREEDGFWSSSPHLTLYERIKYRNDNVLLEKYMIIEEERTRTYYNWNQCFDCEMLKKEIESQGFKCIDIFSNVAGEPYEPVSDTIAIVVEKFE